MNCPTLEQLREFSIGLLPAADQATLFDHLRSCNECEERLDALDAAEDNLAEDNLVKGLHKQSATANPYLGEPEYQAAIGKLRDWSDDQQPSSQSDIPVIIGGYELESELGHGGMGTVYRATHQKLGKQVAIKVLAPAFRNDEEGARRFEREMASIGRLEHPNLVQAFDAGEDEDVLYLVMELLEGENLSRVVKRRGPLSRREAVEYVVSAAAAVKFIHEHGMIHRDIKPSNIFLTKDGGVKVLDLGLVSSSSSEDLALTSYGKVMGTRLFMPPEQMVNSRDVDERADVYGLTATLFYLMTGKGPHEVDEYSSECGHLQSILQEGLAADPDDRIPTARELIKQLESWLINESAGPVFSAQAVEPKLVPKTHSQIPTLVLLMFVLVCGVGGTYWFMKRNDSDAESNLASNEPTDSAKNEDQTRPKDPPIEKQKGDAPRGSQPVITWPNEVTFYSVKMSVSGGGYEDEVSGTLQFEKRSSDETSTQLRYNASYTYLPSVRINRRSLPTVRPRFGFRPPQSESGTLSLQNDGKLISSGPALRLPEVQLPLASLGWIRLGPDNREKWTSSMPVVLVKPRKESQLGVDIEEMFPRHLRSRPEPTLGRYTVNWRIEQKEGASAHLRGDATIGDNDNRSPIQFRGQAAAKINTKDNGLSQLKLEGVVKSSGRQSRVIELMIRRMTKAEIEKSKPRPPPPPAELLKALKEARTSSNSAALSKTLVDLSRVAVDKNLQADVQKQLHELMAEENLFARLGASRALARWGSAASESVWRSAIDDEHFAIAHTAIDQLGKLKSTKAIKDLVRVYPKHAFQTDGALRQIGPAAEKDVHSLAALQDWGQRARVATLLGDIGTEASIEVLRQLAKDENSHVASSAKRALKKLNDRLAKK